MTTMTEAIEQMIKRLSELTDEELQSEFDACKGGAVARAFKSLIDSVYQDEQQ